MKQNYVKPNLRMVEVDNEQLLASSPDGNGFGGSDKPSAVKGKRIWDDEEY